MLGIRNSRESDSLALRPPQPTPTMPSTAHPPTLANHNKEHSPFFEAQDLFLVLGFFITLLIILGATFLSAVILDNLILSESDKIILSETYSNNAFVLSESSRHII